MANERHNISLDRTGPRTFRVNEQPRIVKADDTDYQERRSAINLIKIWLRKYHIGRCADCGSGRIEV